MQWAYSVYIVAWYRERMEKLNMRTNETDASKWIAKINTMQDDEEDMASLAKFPDNKYVNPTTP
jgi:hypothetical protein